MFTKEFKLAAVNATDYRFLLLGFYPRFLSGRLELELVGRYRRGLLRRVPDCGLPPAASDDAPHGRSSCAERVSRLAVLPLVLEYCGSCQPSA
jgi:hypothetical protein